MKQRFEKAFDQFCGLPGVNNDPMNQTTIGDLVAAARFEVDLFEAGESELGLQDIRQIKRFLRRWERYK